MAGRPRGEAGLGISASPLQRAGHDDPLQGPVEARKYQERRAFGSCLGQEKKSFPTAVSSGFTRRAPLPPPPSVQSSPVNPSPPACGRRLRGERWTWSRQGWCGAVAPQTVCSPSVLAPVLWTFLSPRMPGSVLGPGRQSHVPSVPAPAPLGTAQGSVRGRATMLPTEGAGVVVGKASPSLHTPS